ncbi:MAG: caspase family protein [Clostridiales bacterium]|nr:caspase family protein [Clostridiales bacterium]
METAEQKKCERGKRYALMAAVGEYSGIPVAGLPTYKRDSDLIRKALVNGLKFENDNIRELGEKGYLPVNELACVMADFAHMLCEEDTFVFYFSGHGKNRALLFSDTGIELQSILDVVDRMPAKNKIVILDCCYSGDFHTGGIRKMSLEDEIRDFAGHGIAVLASSAADEVSRIVKETGGGCVTDRAGDEFVSLRLGPGGNHSLYTGMLSAAIMSSRIIKKGRISLQDIHEETCRLMQAWNRTHPAQHQQPIYRSCMGGAVYFQVEEYYPYTPLDVCYETDKYILCHVKPLSTAGIKRLAAFVIVKESESPVKEPGEVSRPYDCVNDRNTNGNDQQERNDIKALLATITLEIAENIRHAEVYASEKSEKRHLGSSARAIWCYFGRDWSDITKHLYFAHTVWAADDEARQLYYKPDGKHSYVIELTGCRHCSNDKSHRQETNLDYISCKADSGIEFIGDCTYGSDKSRLWANHDYMPLTADAVTDYICLFENISYKMLRKMQQPMQPRDEFIAETKTLLNTIINLAEEFITAMQEIANLTRTVESVKAQYSGWIKDVKRQYLKLTDGDVPPDDLRVWVDEIEELAGSVLDLAILLEQTTNESFGGREQWLMEQAVRRYYEGLESVIL